MPNDQLSSDLSTHLTNLKSLRDFLTRIYYDPQFGRFFDRPVINLLITGCDYLITNLQVMQVRWTAKT
jgi:hypothetical protein